STSCRKLGSSCSLSPMFTPARASRYSARATGFLSVWYASLSARDRDSAATRSAAGAFANRSGCSSLVRSKNARSITAGSRSNCAGRPSSPNASLELDALSTTTRTLGVRIVELEAVTHHAAHVVEGHAAEIHEALRVDDDRDTVVGDRKSTRLNSSHVK